MKQFPILSTPLRELDVLRQRSPCFFCTGSVQLSTPLRELDVLRQMMHVTEVGKLFLPFNSPKGIRCS